MKCPKCQTENEIGAKFCNECGGKLEIACPECNKMNRPGSRFCNECGHETVSTWQIMGTQTHEGDAVFIDQSVFEWLLNIRRKIAMLALSA